MAQRLIGLGLLAAVAGAAAQGLSDPTRPPSAADERVARSEAPVSRLQSVLISPARKLAVIDGQTVALGGRLGEATVISIAPTQVILQSGATYQTLKLLPGIEKEQGTEKARGEEKKP
jgi:MSHA biogenesis protein MshK